jgi:hypothetical protein
VFLEPQMWSDTPGHKYEETLQDPVTGTFFNRETAKSGL